MRPTRPVPCVAFLVAACSGGTGKLTITTYGEDFIEKGIPAAKSAQEEGIVDGYSVKFDKFLIALSDITVKDKDDVVGAEAPTQSIFDMVEAGPHAVVTFDAMDAQTWHDIGVSVKPASNAVPGNADDIDVAHMNDHGYSVYVSGTATSTGAKTFRFGWGFATATRFDGCVDADDAPGAIVPNGGSVDVEMTIHGDHFFYDDLQSPDTKLRFAAMARADTNGDGDLTLDELEAVDINAIPVPYGTGGDSSVDNLRQFAEALTRTLVHYRGEGHCRQHKL